MARKTERGGKFINVHSRTWNMARKLKIMENVKHPPWAYVSKVWPAFGSVISEGCKDIIE